MNNPLCSREGRPYRSHLHPACFSCRKRKSRCKTRNSADVCLMCQAHGSECIFPHPDDTYRPRKSPANLRSRLIHPRNGSQHARTSPVLHQMSQPADHSSTRPDLGPQIVPALVEPDPPPMPSTGGDEHEHSAEGLPKLMGIVAETSDDSSHIVSPAVAGDNDILESYLSAVPTSRSRCLARTSSASNHPLRPVRFSLVPRRPLGVAANQSLAASKCEVIEKFMDPNIDEYLNLFFRMANTCFPIFDEPSFRSAYSSHKEKISPALLCNLYANSLVYWRSSPVLCSGHTPDIRFIWNQANEALHSELFLSPGISTVMSIIINVCGRPSTSIFGNGGMVGTAVALSNALGLNRDPSSWNISHLEKSLRIRIWWLVIIQDRWCSLAYGTPLQVHRAQYDVPFPSVDDLCFSGASPTQRAAASVFVALTTLTDVLARYLEHVYSVSKNTPSSEMSELDLEQILSEWEESLSDEIRHLVLRGTHLDIPGGANFRLAYLAVKLLLRRIQLDLSKLSAQAEDDTASPFYMRAQRAAEEIVHLVQELGPTQLQGFWIPLHAFSITSATMFLLRSGLRLRGHTRNMPLKIAKDMISALQAHRLNYDWDLADNCLDHCGELVERIGANNSSLHVDGGLVAPEFPELPENLNLDMSALEETLFSWNGSLEGYVF